MDIISTGAAMVALVIGAAVAPTAPPAPPAAISTPARTAPPMPIPPPSPEPLLPKGTHVRIAFNPPLGVLIRYLLTDARPSSDGKCEVQVAELTVRFERLGDGYRMESRSEFLRLQESLANNSMIPLLERPVILHLDRDGVPVGIEDEETYWKGVDAFVDALAHDPKFDPEVAVLLADSVRMMRQMPPAERLDLLASNIEPIISNMLDMDVGASIQRVAEEVTLPFPVLDPKVKQVSTQTLVEASAGRARIDVVTRFDPAEMAKLLREMSQRAPKGQPAEKVPETVPTTATRYIDRSTGLLRWLNETHRDCTSCVARERTLMRIEDPW